jgi:hypothetical protein
VCGSSSPHLSGGGGHEDDQLFRHQLGDVIAVHGHHAWLIQLVGRLASDPLGDILDTHGDGSTLDIPEAAYFNTLT